MLRLKRYFTRALIHINTIENKKHFTSRPALRPPQSTALMLLLNGAYGGLGVNYKIRKGKHAMSLMGRWRPSQRAPKSDNVRFAP